MGFPHHLVSHKKWLQRKLKKLFNLKYSPWGTHAKNKKSHEVLTEIEKYLFGLRYSNLLSLSVSHPIMFKLLNFSFTVSWLCLCVVFAKAIVNAVALTVQQLVETGAGLLPSPFPEGSSNGGISEGERAQVWVKVHVGSYFIQLAYAAQVNISSLSPLCCLVEYDSSHSGIINADHILHFYSAFHSKGS